MTKIKKVFFLFMLPFNKEDWIRYDMQYLIDSGIEPIYVDLSKIFFKSPVEVPTLEEMKPFRIVINSKKELKDLMIANNSNSILALDTPLRSNTTWLYRMITSVGIKYIGLNTRWFPRGLRNKDKKAQFKKINLSYLFKKLKFELEYHASRKFVNKAEAVFIANNKSKKLDKVTNSKTLVYYSHSSDYDQAMLSDDKLSEDYIVFIDVYYPHHPDLKIYGLLTDESSEVYHDNMNKLFHKLEEKTGKKVIICAHPRRPKDKSVEFDFPVVYNQTAKYLKQASLVVNHYSTAVNYAVIYNKPILYVTMDAFSKNGSAKLIDIISSRLGSVVINGNDLQNLDIDNNYKSYHHINKELYQKFLSENIIHDKSSKKRFGEDLMNCISKIV